MACSPVAATRRFSAVCQAVVPISMLARLCCALAVCSIVLFASALARAQTRIEVPSGCGSEGELRAGLARLLGAQRAADAVPKRLSIVKTDAGDYSLLLELAGESRELRDPDCRALFNAAVIVAAVTIDPSVQALAPPPAVEPTPAAEPTPASEPAAPAPEGPEPTAPAPERSATPREKLPIRGEITVGGGAVIALLPALAPSLELSGALALGDVGLALAARYLAPAEQSAGGTHAVEVQGLGARLSAFYDPARFVRFSAGVAADRLDGQGLGSAVRGSSEAGVALAVLIEAAATPVRLPPCFMTVAISGHYALLRPSFEIAGYGEVFRVPWVGGSGVMRLGWEFR